MTRRALPVVAALVVLLAVLALWPPSTKSDQPAGRSILAPSAFTPIGSSAVPTTVAVSNPPAECREWALGCRRYPAPTTAGTAEKPTPSRALPESPELRASQPVWGDDTAATGLGTGWYESARPATRTPSPVTDGSPSPVPSAPRPVSVAPVRSPAAPSTGVPSSPAASVTGPKAGLDKATAGPAIFKGTASWFDSPIGVSAAGPALRTAIGPDWRGTLVKVTGPHGFAWTELGDWCLCHDRMIDLDSRSFAALAPLSQGLMEVTISW